MNSIYDKASNEAIIARINQLTSETEGLWGKMNVDQMFKHCSAAIDVAFGEKEVKVSLMMKILGRVAKNKVLNNEFLHNSPTAKEFIFIETYDFEASKKEFIERFSRFSNEGKSAIKTMNHPFWGKMTYEDWDKLMWRHVDHHLRQFGV
ncbi:DUF1569 domain-containing protein [Flavobacterium celericrescens]|uniref:DUF1569 domain-containing protein n=1 Tax=Flavobacterium celericrescens TaxID=2709780 RepID=A0ABX0IAU8_9FLAO|nr:DUF1569 domain-containing protein [Flavobacterium celericrescens]NHM04207.1 DUF1569 domain-containing protein [Flavobacterium celericrescens]